MGMFDVSKTKNGVFGAADDGETETEHDLSKMPVPVIIWRNTKIPMKISMIASNSPDVNFRVPLFPCLSISIDPPVFYQLV
jgi:hypothetical protein